MPLKGDAKREYQRQWVQARKTKAREYLGNMCANCGETQRLEFDHIDPNLKPIVHKNCSSLNWTQAWSKLIRELDLCQLLCYTCHKKKTQEQLRTTEHGLTMYKVWKCRCSICKAAKRVDNANRYI